MTVLAPLTPAAAADLVRRGRAVLVDVREPDEIAREAIPGAIAAPLSALETADLAAAAGREVIFTCRSGARTAAHCERLAARVAGPAHVLEGGLTGWKAAGLPTRTNTRAPLEMMRQVQIAAGGLILTGAAVGLLVHPAGWGLAAFVGAGLLTAGVTGFCGMARLLAVLPWNRRAA
jgi:rhodanese-related sulfurtransferase